MKDYFIIFGNRAEFCGRQYSTNEHNQYPNISYIRSTSEIKINELFLFNKEDAVAGDILMAKEDEQSNISIFGFVKRKNYKKVIDNSDFKPIGVVAVPSNLTPDNTVRVMSLVNMSLETPETGVKRDDNTSIYWGGGNGIGTSGLTQYGNYTLPFVTKEGESYTSTLLLDPNIGFVSSDIFGEKSIILPNDIFSPSVKSDWDRYYDKVTGYYYYIENDLPCWSDDDSFNRDGFSGTLIANPYGLPSLYFADGKVTNDLNGRGNTDAILEMVSSPIIKNESSQGNYPAAELCNLFHTIGTSSGDWYLPSISELIIMFVKMLKINTTLKSLELTSAVPVRTWVEYTGNYSEFGYFLLSSNEHSNNGFWTLSPLYGLIYGGVDKELDASVLDFKVRSFISL